MNNVVKKGILLAAGLLLAGCGDNYWLLNNSGQDAQVNGNTVKNGRCIELEDSFWGSDFDEKVSVGGTAYELDPGHSHMERQRHARSSNRGKGNRST